LRKIVFFYFFLGFITLNASNFFSYTFLGIKASTLGPGLELGTSLTENLSFRLGANSYKDNFSSNNDDLHYNLNAKLRSDTAIFDYHLFSTGFIVSVGMVYNQNGVALQAKPAGSSYEINGHTYNASDVGTLVGDLSFPKYAPYVGFGYSTASLYDGLHLEFNVGAIHEGDANLILAAQCSNSIPQEECAQLENDVKVQKAEIDDDLASISKYIQWYPVISLGISYTF